MTLNGNDGRLNVYSYTVFLHCPVLSVIKVSVTSKLREEGVSYNTCSCTKSILSRDYWTTITSGAIKCVLVSVIIVLEPDLNVNTAGVFSHECQSRGLGPHFESFANISINLRSGEFTGISPNFVRQPSLLPPRSLQGVPLLSRT